MMNTQQLVVFVGSWSNPRRILVTSAEVAVEITLGKCSHCATCAARRRRVSATLEARGIPHTWRYPVEGSAAGYVVFAAPQAGADVAGYVREVLDLPVEVIRRL